MNTTTSRFNNDLLQLTEQLQLHQLESWSEPLNLWLKHFEALPELALLNESAPFEITSMLKLSKAKLTDIEFATAVAQCRFHGWQARFPGTPFRWNCFEQSLENFCKLFPIELPVVYESNGTPSITIAWLLGLLTLSNSKKLSWFNQQFQQA